VKFGHSAVQNVQFLARYQVADRSLGKLKNVPSVLSTADF
jgi:hypothetical protein